MRNLLVSFLGFFVFATVTLANAAVSITVAPTRASVTITQPQQFTATVTNSSNTNVTWSVDSIAGGNSTVGTIDVNGIYMPPSKAGFHIITATSVADTSKSASASLVVTNNPGVFTYHMNNNRSGANTNETVLAPGNVASSFGQLFARNVDGNVYAQPLYVANLQMPNVGYRNVVFVATEHDSVYAFDADGRSTAPLWRTSFINPSAGITTIPSSALPAAPVGTEVGITGTPVIDPATNTMYVLAATLENGTYHNRLHALDIITGAERSGSPVDIRASYPGTGDGSTGGKKSRLLRFDVTHEFNRSALLLSNGVVYIAWASYLDQPPWHGWLMAYAANNLAQLGVWVSTPNGSAGGIWQAGCAPAADENGFLYFSTGNGTFSVATGGKDYGDTVVKLQLTSAGLSVVDYFTPNNQAYLESQDLDLGSTCTLLVPANQNGSAKNEVITGGKQDQVYVLDRDNLGQYNDSNSTAIQVLNDPFGTTAKLKTSAAYWNGKLYWVAQQQVVQSFSLQNGLMSPNPISQGAYIIGFPGATPVVSANGTANAIVWFWQRGTGILHAYDANNLSNRLYVSADSGTQVPFVSPVVVNGKVYVGTNNQLVAFGLISPASAPDFTIGASPASRTVTAGSGTTYSAAISAVNGFTGTVTFAASGLPAGATASFSPTSVSGSGSSTLTVNTASSTPTGSYPINITGTSGTLQHTAQVTLVVSSSTGSADFSLSATPASRTIAQNAYNTYTVTVSPLNGFNGVVTFAASGLPTGATATFTPTSITGSGSTSMRISCVGTTVPGNYTVTITATSGSIRHTTTVALAVTGFSLSVSPSSQTVIRGHAVTYTATVTDLNGYSATKTMSVTGLPSGATATFSPSSISGSGTSTMTVQTATSTPTGTYTLTVRATSSIGSLYHTSVVSLSVQ